MRTIVTIGSGYSGSSAVYELLQSTNDFHDPFPNVEFSITYDPGGIIDIENKVAKLIRLMFIALRMESALEYHVYRFDTFHRLPIFHLHIFLY